MVSKSSFDFLLKFLTWNLMVMLMCLMVSGNTYMIYKSLKLGVGKDK